MEQISLDESQSAALELALTSPSTVVAGAAGTGKTRVLLAAAARIADSGQSAVVLAAGRRAADDLRTRITEHLGKLPQSLSVRTPQAWAFTILQSYAAVRERQTPELITGPTQDAIISELLGELGPTIRWPNGITAEVTQLPGFRDELRNLLTRAAELGLHGLDLVRIGREHGDDMWAAGGELMVHYENALALEDATVTGGADRFDHARLIHQAARLLDSPDAWAGGVPPTWDWILIDDYQNATLATASLLTVARSAGTKIIMAADPDTAVEGFRGGIAHLPGLARGTKEGLGLGAEVMVLDTRHRAGENLARIQDSLVSRIGVAGIGTHRLPRPGEGEDSLAIKTYPSSDQQYSGIARAIRHEHIRRGLAYDDVAIITRARNVHTELERVLVDAGVKVRPASRDQPLRYIPVVRALMDVIIEANGSGLDDAALLGLLGSPLLGLEPTELRSLRRYVAQWSRERDLDNPIRALLEDPPGEAWAAPLTRLAAIVNATRAALSDGGNAEAVLWAAWQAAGRAEEWRDEALAGGTQGRACSALLDAAMTMFRVAQRMVDRDGRASSIQLVEELEGQEFAEDTIARTGRESGVHLLTPAMAIGQEFELVILADVNDGVWPNVRVRDGLFGAGRLAEMHLDRLTDGISGLRSVLDDELRMLAAAAGRAKRALVLTAVDSEDASHSRFIDLIADEVEIEQVESAQLSMSISGVVGRLRSVLSDPDLNVSEEDKDIAAAVLASLPTWTDQRLAGVDPATWIPVIDPSTDDPWGPTATLSPSTIERIRECPLRWFVESRGLTDADDTHRLEVGTLIHGLAEDFPDGNREDLLAAFEERWPQVGSSMVEGLESLIEYENTRAMVESLAVYLSESPPASTEQHVRIERNEFTVSGRIDRIEQASSGPVIVDFKTSKKPVSEANARENPQLKLYQWVYEQVYGEPTAEARLVYPAHRRAGNRPSVRTQRALTDEDRLLVEDLLTNVRDDMSGTNLAARVNDGCRTCRVKDICPLYEEGALFS